MKRTIYTVISLLLLAIVTTGCKKEEKIYSVSIDKESLTMPVDEQYQLTATILPISSEERDINWISSDNSVVSVSSDGLVTAEGVGTATVTLKVNDVIAKCDVTIIKRGDYQMKVILTSEEELGIYKLIFILPAPLTNEYQEISNTYCNYGDNIESCNGNHIFYYYATSFTNGMIIYETFDYTPKTVAIDFSKKPEKKNEYGGTNPGDFLDSDGKYINLNNNTIKAIGDSIWAISDSKIDYARKCYEHTANILEYKSGWWNSLDEIIANGGGKSSDLTTFYVNLLRYKGIPARHNIGRNPSDGRHVWADFYDEEYGWIPVDVTYKSSHPENDYFGLYDGNYTVLGQGLTTIHNEDLDLVSYPLQSFYYRYRRTSRTGKLTDKFSFEQTNQ